MASVHEPTPARPRAAERYAPALPDHLKQFVVDQGYERYTPVDHAVWRYIMRQNLDFLREHAHESYVEGLRRTGISVERIPRIEEMNEILGRIGWAAVTVDGFIPPAAFMEFQAHRVLVIAADMRQIEHIGYTPAPDIVHEAAGHAPIIAEATYAEYLRRFGEIGARAMSSRKDYELYEAIRHLSILKEMPDADPAAIARAERDVEERQANLGEPSEMARLSRLHWWTVEYGLIGTLADPKLYGAGLLSSIGESAACLSEKVAKLPYDLHAADVAFDITSMQPQLFVTPSFDHLIEVLERFADGMAFRTGGLAGLQRAVDSANVATVELSSGLQVSGVVTRVEVDADSRPVFFATAGPSALAVAGRQLQGHGKAHHADGYSSPLGPVRGAERPLEALDDAALARLGVVAGAGATLEFVSGITVSGRVETVTRRDGTLVLLTFSGCTVTRGDEVLFRPEWGVYDMAVGERVVSVFSGAADTDAYQQVSLVPEERTARIEHSERSRALHRLYDRVRANREGGGDTHDLVEVWHVLRTDHPEQWLPPGDRRAARGARRRRRHRAGDPGAPDLAAPAQRGARAADRQRPPPAELIPPGPVGTAPASAPAAAGVRFAAMDPVVLLVFAGVYAGMVLGGLPGLALDRSGVALLGALVLVGSGRVTPAAAWEAVDVPTVALLFGLMVVSAQLRLGGFYAAVTRRLALAALAPPALLAVLVAVAGALSAFLANDIVCLAMAPLLLEGCARRGLDPVPFLLGLACAANVGSAATLIGNPQNMLIGQRLGLSFAGYLLDGGIPAVLGLAAVWAVIVRAARGRWLAGTPIPAVEAPPFDRWQTQKGLAVLALVVLAFLAAPWPREVTALAAAALLLTSRRMASREILGLVDWHLLVLFFGLFVVNHAVAATGAPGRAVAALAASGVDLTAPAWLFAGVAVLSNLVSNVPAVMLLLPAATHPLAGPVLALASTLAGNLILVGSIANLIVAEQSARLGVVISWRRHARIGVPVTLATLALAAVWLALRA